MTLKVLPTSLSTPQDSEDLFAPGGALKHFFALEGVDQKKLPSSLPTPQDLEESQAWSPGYDGRFSEVGESCLVNDEQSINTSFRQGYSVEQNPIINANQAVRNWIDWIEKKGKGYVFDKRDPTIPIQEKMEQCAEDIVWIFKQMIRERERKKVRAEREEISSGFKEVERQIIGLYRHIKVFKVKDEENFPTIYLKVAKASTREPNPFQVKGGEKKVDFVGRFQLLPNNKVVFTPAVLVQPLLKELNAFQQMTRNDHFTKEAKFYSRHSDLKGIVRVHGCYKEEQLAKRWIALQCYENDLYHIINKLTPEERLIVVEKILEMMVTLEKKGILHRDLKFENIFVNGKGQKIEVVLGDWSFSIDSKEEDLTKGFSICGTYNYMDPIYGKAVKESLRSMDYDSIKHSDKWSLLIMLLYLLEDPVKVSNKIGIQGGKREKEVFKEKARKWCEEESLEEITSILQDRESLLSIFKELFEKMNKTKPEERLTMTKIMEEFQKLKPQFTNYLLSRTAYDWKIGRRCIRYEVDSGYREIIRKLIEGIIQSLPGQEIFERNNILTEMKEKFSALRKQERKEKIFGTKSITSF